MTILLLTGSWVSSKQTDEIVKYDVSISTHSTSSATYVKNVCENGAIPDGRADNTPVFQRLLDEMGGLGGGTVFIPAGEYVIRGSLRIPANVTLKGVSEFTTAAKCSASAGNGQSSHMS
jgi:polygalacturonase